MIQIWSMAEAAWMPPGRAAIAVDPGLHTGVAVLMPNGSVEAAEGTWQEANDYIEGWLRSGLLNTDQKPNVIVERFIINAETAKKSQAPWALEGLGVVRHIAHGLGIDIAPDLQMPVAAKRFATNNRLKAQGWYISTKGGHVNDGLRHLYLFLADRGRLAPPEGVI